MTGCRLSCSRSAWQAIHPGRRTGVSWQRSIRLYSPHPASSQSAKTLRCATALARDRPGASQLSFVSCQMRHLCKSPRQYQQKDEDEAAKTVVEQTKDLRKTISKKLSQNLTHENIYNLPNALTASRLLLTPVIGYLVLHDAHAWAVGLFVYAGTTDLIDGWIARRWNLQTVVGSVIDPMADKLLMTVLTVCLALKGALPMYLATLILGRDVSLAVAAIYYRWASLPAPKTLARYWDFSLPSAEVRPTTVSKYNTALQLLLIGATTAMPLLDSGIHLNEISLDQMLTAAQWLVAGTTAWSGLSYLYTRDAVAILGDDKTAAQKKQILRRGRRVIAGSFGVCLGLALYLES